MRSTRRAFTLIEAVTTMTIVAVIVAISSPVVFTAVDGYAAAAGRAEIAGAASNALERITCEVRDIPLKSGESTAKPSIVSVAAGSIVWSTNSSLTLTGTTLELALAGGTARPLLTNVQSFGVQAYDESNTALGATLSGTQCDAIRRLMFTITTTRAGVTETMRTRVFLRCMMAGASP